MISRSASPVAFATSSISSAHARASATRPCAQTLVVSPVKMGTSASRRLSDFAKARAGCRLVQTSGVLQPLSAAQAVPRRVRSSSSLASRSGRTRQGRDQFEPLVEMGDRLGQGHALQCQLAGGLPERNCSLSEARSR